MSDEEIYDYFLDDDYESPLEQINNSEDEYLDASKVDIADSIIDYVENAFNEYLSLR